jgi:PAS domain S-box-containing protein
VTAIADEGGRTLDALPDGVVVIGPEATITYLNRVAERACGWTREDAIGKPYGEVLPLRDTAGFFVHESNDPFTTSIGIIKGSPEREYILQRRDGSEIWVAVRASFVRDAEGRLTQVLATLREAERRQRLERRTSDLISTVSHEIRSPLTSVKGFTSTLLHRWDRFNDEQKQHMLRTINHDADRVTRLLKDLLDVSRLEAGRLELRRHEVDVVAIATEVALRLRLDADGRPIEVRFGDDIPKVVADPDKIEQVLTNLVDNALKYAAKGPVSVVGRNDADEIVIEVTDAGEGIDPKHLPHIFAKWYRRSTGERTHGTGLGLYICNGIVHAHGGRIWVERSDATGSTFAFSLPKGPS